MPVEQQLLSDGLWHQPVSCNCALVAERGGLSPVCVCVRVCNVCVSVLVMCVVCNVCVEQQLLSDGGCNQLMIYRCVLVEKGGGLIGETLSL